MGAYDVENNKRMARDLLKMCREKLSTAEEAVKLANQATGLLWHVQRQTGRAGTQ